MNGIRWWLRKGALTVALLVLAGCGRPTHPLAGPEADKHTVAPVSTKMEKPTVTVSDPERRWTFEIHAKTGQAGGPEGPFELLGATGQYLQHGQPPVLVSADRVLVDKQTQRVDLQGSVRIKRDWILVEGERIRYDLKTGKVLAEEQPKCTVTLRPAEAGPKSQIATPGGN